MKNRSSKLFLITAALFLLFVIFTVVVSTVDIQPIGPEGSQVGLATLNRAVFEKLGTNNAWYDLTEWLGIVALAIASGFAVFGMIQLIKRKSLLKVDRQILILGAFYVIVSAFYFFFELVVINFRPVILDSGLEASYPSSHTVMSICIISTAIAESKRLLAERKALRISVEIICVALAALTVIGRLLSGVHWFTDIAAGVLLSSALVMLYLSVLSLNAERINE